MTLTQDFPSLLNSIWILSLLIIYSCGKSLVRIKKFRFSSRRSRVNITLKTTWFIITEVLWQDWWVFNRRKKKERKIKEIVEKREKCNPSSHSLSCWGHLTLTTRLFDQFYPKRSVIFCSFAEGWQSHLPGLQAWQAASCPSPGAEIIDWEKIPSPLCSSVFQSMVRTSVVSFLALSANSKFQRSPWGQVFS